MGIFFKLTLSNLMIASELGDGDQASPIDTFLTTESRFNDFGLSG